MIYSRQIEWTFPFKEAKKHALVMLDLNVLDEIPQEFNEIERETGIPARQVRKSFQDNLLCDTIKYLNTRVKCVILRYESYGQKVQKMTRLMTQSPLNQHEVIMKQYQNDVKIGVRVPIDQLSAFPSQSIKPYLKQITILSFQLHVDTLQEDLSLLSNFVKKNLTIPRQRLHIHFRMHAEANLAILHHELLKHQLPIEYIILSSNILNVHLEQGQLLSHPQRQAYVSIRDYGRYVGSAYDSILESVEASQEVWSQWGGVKQLETNNTFRAINKLLYLLKEVEYYYNKQQSRSYSGGVRVPSLLFINSIRQFRGISANYGFLKDCLENYALYPIKVLYEGQFRGLESIRKTND